MIDVLHSLASLVAQFLGQKPESLTAESTGVLTAITGVIAGLNIYLTKTSKEAADASVKAANAAADALEMEWRPVVVVRLTLGGSAAAKEMQVQNIGRGAALQVVFFREIPDEPNWRCTDPFFLAGNEAPPGSSLTFLDVARLGSPPDDDVWGTPPATPDPRAVVMCQDVYGNLHRWIHVLGRLDTVRKTVLLDGKKEPWVDWYRATLPTP